jgi:hypothetical protein
MLSLLSFNSKEKMKFILLALYLFIEFICNNNNNNNVEATPVSKYRPIVIWHGMGDTCCNPESIGKVIEVITEALPGVYVHSIMLGNQESEDKKAGFFW